MVRKELLKLLSIMNLIFDALNIKKMISIIINQIKHPSLHYPYTFCTALLHENVRKNQ